MTFPAYIYLFGYQIHPHLLFESLAYTIGFQTFLRTRKFWKHPVVPQQQNLWLIVGCIFGALIGSKLLNMLEMPLDYWAHRDDIAYWLEGKTIVGGYIGGWLGVEIVKKKLGITYATGDAYVFPLIIGTAIGRVGCFLSGLQDQTYGIPTSLPWGVDFGDGIPRHPAQLYEIVTVLAVGVYLLFRIRRPYVNGWLFRFYMFTYFLFRFLVEFIKPRYHPLGLSAIQIAALAGAIYCARIFLRDNPYNFPANKRSSYV